MYRRPMSFCAPATYETINNSFSDNPHDWSVTGYPSYTLQIGELIFVKGMEADEISLFGGWGPLSTHDPTVIWFPDGRVYLYMYEQLPDMMLRAYLYKCLGLSMEPVYGDPAVKVMGGHVTTLVLPGKHIEFEIKDLVSKSYQDKVINTAIQKIAWYQDKVLAPLNDAVRDRQFRMSLSGSARFSIGFLHGDSFFFLKAGDHDRVTFRYALTVLVPTDQVVDWSVGGNQSPDYYTNMVEAINSFSVFRVLRSYFGNAVNLKESHLTNTLNRKLVGNHWRLEITVDSYYPLKSGIFK